MKIVVIGSNPPIGSQLVATLRTAGHDAVAASPESDFDGVTGEGLASVLRGARVVVDVSDPPSFEDAAAMTFITASLLEHEAAAGVTHHVALSPVGGSDMLESGYFRARCAQEQLIKASRIPYSIVRATLLFENLRTLADVEGNGGGTVHIRPVLVQPVAAHDVVRLLAAVAVDAPLKGCIEIGGPEPFYLDGLVQRVLGASHDRRAVVGDSHARYFGTLPGERSLVAADEAELGEIRFDDWLRHQSVNGAGGCRSRCAVANAGASAGASAGVSAAAATGRESVEGPAGEPATLKSNEFRVGDVPPGSVLLMRDVAIFSVAGGFCATQAMCTHRAGPLSEGTVDDTTVTCPLHGSRFDIWTGAVLRGPATEPLKTYRVTIDGDIGRVSD